MTGSLAPPPPYGSEQGSILLEAGREGQPEGGGFNVISSHGRSRSGNFRVAPPQSPGPVRSPTEISLAQLVHIPSNEDVGEGTSRSVGEAESPVHPDDLRPQQDFSAPPPEYTSPEGSMNRRDSGESEDGDAGRPLLRRDRDEPQVPSYDFAVGNPPERRRDDERRNDTR